MSKTESFLLSQSSFVLAHQTAREVATYQSIPTLNKTDMFGQLPSFLIRPKALFGFLFDNDCKVYCLHMQVHTNLPDA